MSGMNYRQRAFTLPELLLALAGAALLSGMAMPAMSAWYQQSRMQAQSGELQALLQSARARAVAAAERITFCVGAAGEGCHGRSSNSQLSVPTATGHSWIFFDESVRKVDQLGFDPLGFSTADRRVFIMPCSAPASTAPFPTSVPALVIERSGRITQPGAMALGEIAGLAVRRLCGNSVAGVIQ